MKTIIQTIALKDTIFNNDSTAPYKEHKTTLGSFLLPKNGKISVINIVSIKPPKEGIKGQTISSFTASPLLFSDFNTDHLCIGVWKDGSEKSITRVEFISEPKMPNKVVEEEETDAFSGTKKVKFFFDDETTLDLTDKTDINMLSQIFTSKITVDSSTFEYIND